MVIETHDRAHLGASIAALHAANVVFMSAGSRPEFVVVSPCAGSGLLWLHCRAKQYGQAKGMQVGSVNSVQRQVFRVEPANRSMQVLRCEMTKASRWGHDQA